MSSQELESDAVARKRANGPMPIPTTIDTTIGNNSNSPVTASMTDSTILSPLQTHPPPPTRFLNRPVHDVTPITSIASTPMAVGSAQPRSEKIPPFFEVSLGPRVDLDQVYWNGLHALRRFYVRNNCPDPILVKLRTNLQGQVAFQLNNENLPDLESASVDSGDRIDTSSALQIGPTPHLIKHEFASYSGPLVSEGTAHAAAVAAASAVMSSADRARLLSSNASSSSSLPSFTSSTMSPSVSLDSLYSAGSLAFSSDNVSSTASPSASGPYHTLSAAGSVTSLVSGFFTPSSNGNLFRPAPTSMPVVPSTLRDATTLDSSMSATLTANTSVRGSALPMMSSLFSDRGSDVASAAPSSSHHAHASKPFHPHVTVTNTATAAALGAYGGGLGGAHEFNQLFNFVNHVDEIRLEPGEVRKVILAFLPNTDDGSAHRDSSTSSAIGGTIGGGSAASGGSGQQGSNLSATPPSNSLLEDTPATFTPADDEANTYDFKEVAGMLMFYGYRVPREIAAAAASPSDLTAVALAAPPPPPEPQQPPPQAIRSLAPSRANSVSGTAAAAAASGAKADCNSVVKFKARMCKSVLWSEVAHQGILFEDCVLDGTFIRDFTVWNKSEIDLYWTLNTAAVSHALTFTDYDTGEPLDTSKPIPAYSHCRVRVTYKPKQLGDFSYEIQLENVNDAANVEVVRIHCVVRSALQDESLVVLSGHQLDFGDITAGQWNTARLVVKNVSEQPMDVKFLAEGSAGPVVFDLSQGALDLDVDPTSLGLFHELGSGNGDARGGSSGGGGGGGGGQGHSPDDGYGPITMGSPPNDWIMPMRSNGSSRTSSPVPSRSISVDMSLADLAGRAGLAGHFGGGGGAGGGGGMKLGDGKRHSGHSPLPGGGHGSRATMNRRGGTGNGGAGGGMAADGGDGDEYDSDSESVVSTRSMRSANSTLAGSGFAGPGSTTTGGISGVSGGTAGMITSMSNALATSPNLGPEGNGAMRGSNLGTSPSENTGAPLPRGPQHIEELTLKAGAERTVIVSYFPEKSMSASDYNAGSLVKRTFRVVLQYAKNRRVIQCKARTCTSFISVSPSIVSFGDTDVGTPKSAPVRITNLSEVPARVELSFASKVLSCLRDEIRIPPKQSVEVKIDIYPRKVNPDYRKQITVLNLFNRDNDQIIEVRSTNIDKQRITWHSFFYRIMTPSSTNYLDFGAVVGNHYSVRTFSIQNVSQSNLVLSVSASTDCVTLYLKRKSTGAKLSNLTAKKMTLGSMADRKTFKRANSDLLAPPSSSSATTAYLDLAVPQKLIPNSAKPSAIVAETEPGTPTNSVDEVVHILQNLNMATLPSFPPNLEQKFVKLTVALRKSLDAVIRNGDLVPITGSHITIAPGSAIECVALLQAPGVRDRRKKLDARLLFSLVEFDSSLLPTMQTVLPVRELLVRCIVCPSVLEVGQRNINFGNIDLHAAMSKTIIVRNKSDVLLSYAIKKTGSIASGDVLLENRFGLIPPHGSREVTFTFQPTMPGLFFEKLTVENIMNPETSQVISLKANVRKPESFSIHTESLDFGVCMVNELSAERVLTLHNTHRTQRTFTVRVEDESLNGVQFEFWVIGSATMEHGVQDVEDKIEVLEQKLKIAKRKGRKDKVDKITETISKLRRGAETIVSTNQQDDAAATEPVSPTPSSTTTAPATPVASQITERKHNSLTLPVEPFAIMKIGVAARAKPVPPGSMSASTHSDASTMANPSSTSGGAIAFKGFIVIHQHKNTDLLKKVAYSCLVCYDQPSFIATLDTAAHPSGDSTPRQRSLSYIGPALAAPIGLPSFDLPLSNEQSVPDSSLQVGSSTGPTTAQQSAKPPQIEEKKTEPPPTSTATAYLETLVVDVGKFPIGQDNTFYFVLTNTGTGPATYSTEDSAVAPSDRFGEVLPGERRVINATVVPKTSGRQSYAVGLVCQGFPQIFTVHFMAVYKDGLIFTQEALPAASDLHVSNTISDVGSGAPIQDVDLGYCYNPKKFTARSAVRITNTMPETVSVSAGSTLSQQVGAFANLDCTSPFSEVVLKPNQSAVAYLAVQPNLTQPPLVMGKKSLITFESRQLVGGFKFTSSSTRSANGGGTGDEICAQHLKFQAVIGPSVLSVSSTFINLGSVSQVCGIDTSFTVFNLSDRMPLHYQVTCSNPDLVTIHDYKAVLRGASTASSSSSGATGEEDQVANRASSPRAAVTITVNPRAFGYFCETVWVTNVNCPEQVSAIMVTLLVDPQIMHLQAPAQLPPSKEVQGTTPLPLIQWDHIFVYQAPNQASAALTTAKVEGMSQVVTITNSSSRPLRVLPYSDLRLEVHPNGDQDSSLLKIEPTPTSAASLPLLDGRAQTCGPVMEAAPGADWTCSIGAPLSPEQLTDDDVQALQQGKSIKVRGLLAFAAEDDIVSTSAKQGPPSFKVIKVVELLGYYCVSRAEVVSPKPGKSVQVQVRRGECTKFSVTVKNTASSPTKLAVGASSTSIRYDGPDALEMEPCSSADLECVVDTVGLASGTHEWSLTILNLHNPSNELVVPVAAKVTSLDLTVEGRGELDDSKTLVLPNLLVPNLAGAPIDAWFTLTNPTPAEVRFNIEAQLIQPLTAFMHLHVLSRYSNTPVNWLALPAGGSIEVKVKAIVRDFAKLTEDACPQWLLDERGIQIGQILFENESGRLAVPVRSQIIEQPCFDLDTTALDLVVGGSPVNIVVSNNSPHHSLTFALSLEYVHDLGGCEINFPPEVTVPPNSSVSVPVQLVKSEFTDSGDTITLHFVDTDSIHQFQRSVRLRFSEPQSPTSLSISLPPPIADDESVGSSNQANARSAPTTPIDGPSSVLSSSSAAAAASNVSTPAPSSSTSSHDLIAIKGCSKRGRLHELDLGQQDLGAGTVTRKLVLELQRPAKCSYRIWSTPPDCSDWLSLSRTEGTLESTSKSHSVTLSFSTNIRNVFSTYLVLENLDYPQDIKYIKVTLEVVARVNARKARAFDVVCNGLGDQPTITFENVFYGQEYTSRSFTIVNHETIPLEFTLKMQNLDPTDATEVLFSTSKSIAKLFKTMVVPAESSIRVYLRLRPSRGPKRQQQQQYTVPATAGQSSVATRPGSPESGPLDLSALDAALSRLEPPPPAHTTPPCLRSNIVEVKEFDVVVNCRLVRDYQQIVHVTATCQEPQLHVSSSDVVIFATISADGTTLHCPQPFTDIVVTNVSTTDSLIVHVHGAVFPFTVELEGGSLLEPTAMVLAPQDQRRVRIQLDADEAMRQIDALRREKYCQAYLVVYNRDQCLERVFVTLRLSLGHLQSFALAWWTNSRSPTFAQLEWLTIDFIRRFGDLAWDKVVDNLALMDQAHFQYRVVVDQLVYLCTISSTLDHILHAASLFFASLLATTTSASGGGARGGNGERYVPEEWVDGLRYFLSFFTARHPVLDALRRIYLLRRNGGMAGVGAAVAGSLGSLVPPNEAATSMVGGGSGVGGGAAVAPELTDMNA